MSNYAQKFIMPNAKMSLEYTTQFDRNIPYETQGHNQLKAVQASTAVSQTGNPALFGPVWASSPYLGLNENSFRFLVGAQWKPIEGGHRIERT